MGNDALAKYATQESTVIAAYNDTYLPPLTATTPGKAIIEIYKNCEATFGATVTKGCSAIPDDYSFFKTALQTLNNAGGSSLHLAMLEGNKNGLLQTIIGNIENPNADNGGIPIDTKPATYYAGYDKIKSSNKLIGSLETVGNAITVTVGGETYSESDLNVHIENKADFKLPAISLLSIEANQKSVFDMNKLKTDQTSFSAEITYSGITSVPVQPTPVMTNGNAGWFDEINILKEIREKTGKDEDGYKLTDNRYDVNKLFGGDLAYLKTILISKTPSITITFSKINMDYAKSVFSMENDISVSLFGFIHLGYPQNSYNTTDIQYNEENQSVTLSFGEPDVSGTPDVKNLTAFIMGGVPYYPGM